MFDVLLSITILTSRKCPKSQFNFLFFSYMKKNWRCFNSKDTTSSYKEFQLVKFLFRLKVCKIYWCMFDQSFLQTVMKIIPVQQRFLEIHGFVCHTGNTKHPKIGWVQFVHIAMSAKTCFGKSQGFQSQFCNFFVPLWKGNISLPLGLCWRFFKVSFNVQRKKPAICYTGWFFTSVVLCIAFHFLVVLTAAKTNLVNF